MKTNEFKQRVDHSLSALKWEEADARRVRNAVNAEEKKRKKGSFTFVLIAAVMLLGMAALAERIFFPDFFDKAFGKGVSGQEACDVEYGAGEGGLVKTVHYPLMERVEVDAEKAQALLGGYILGEGGTLSIDGYTFTLENAVLDQNGVGVLLVKITNPDGHSLKRDWEEYPADRPVPAGAQVKRASGDYPYMDDRAYVAQDSFTDTEMEYVIYTVPMEPLPLMEALSLECYVLKPLGEEWDAQSQTLPIDVPARVPARTYEAEGVRVSLSPLGMRVDYDFMPESEKILQQLVIRYDDGSAYTVIGDGVVNTSVHSAEYGTWSEWIAFNRLADPERIADIVLEARALDSAEKEYTLNAVLTAKE